MKPMKRLRKKGTLTDGIFKKRGQPDQTLNNKN